MANDRRNKNRHGVLLLIILALLAMFGATAIAFVILTRSQKGGADAFHREARDTENAEKLLAQAMAQVIRGSNHSMSVLQIHSLLEDLNGNITPGIVTVSPTTLAGGYIGVQMPQAHLRVGCWLTMVDGDAAPQSRQIENYSVNTTTGVTTAVLKEFANATAAVGDRYIVQNAPWRGLLCQKSIPPATIRSICGGQMIEFTAVSPSPRDDVPPTLIPMGELHRFAGAVLTFTSGPAAGRSTRILGFVPSPSVDGGQLRVAALDGIATSDLVTYIQNGNTCEYMINSLPFSGTGAGLNLTATSGERLSQTMGEDANNNGVLDPGEDSNGNGVLDSYPQIHYALAPNPAHFSRSIAKGYGDPAGPGGVNEDYDAVDYQNMLLSTGQPIDTNGDNTLDTFIPSLHRSELVRYWFELMIADSTAFKFNWPSGWDYTQKLRALSWPEQYATAMDLADRETMLAVMRRIILRPLRVDHPNFTGSNPDFNPVWDGVTANEGAWDVDNDGDGVPDSIWVDLGLPARPLPDGRLYKPLFAILCKDLDGCLNINAHGSSAQLAANYASPTSGPYPGATGPIRLLRGGGYGPADVCLTEVLAPQDAANLLHGRNSGGIALEGRYGESFASSAEAGITGSTNPLSLLKRFEVPQNYPDIFTSGNVHTAKLRSYCAPPDFWARGTVALDYRGQPFYDALAWTNENTNNPYDLDLTRRVTVQDSTTHTHVDNPFAPAELEWLLRPYDLDAPMLVSRLRGLDQNNTIFDNRHALTTDSWDIPSPSNTLIPEQSTAIRGHASKITDLLRARLIEGHTWSEPLSIAQERQIVTEMSTLLSWDLAANLRMDINRPFGNGRDDDGDQTVDEPDEGALQQGWSDVFGGSGVTFQLTNGVTAASDPNTARQLYARHLFVLAMLLWDRGYIQPTTPGTADDGDGLSESQKRELTIRRLAQWSVNVVDFRDADSAMTPFEYDKNPFDGWGVDGDLTTDEVALGTCLERRVVWGCEAPELLITETLAFHDRRVIDTAQDNGIGKKRYEWDGTQWVLKDPDLDQPRIPQGSAFFELYCTHNPTNFIASGDLYTYDSTNKWRLKLDALAPADDAGRRYPVWRMVISDFKSVAGQDVKQRLADRPNSTSLEPRQSHATPHPETDDKFNLQSLTTDLDMVDVDIERIIWFVNQSPTGFADEDRIFYRRSGSTYLAPGRYLVIGPRQTTPIGALATALGTPSERRIQLAGGVMVKDSSGIDQYLEVINGSFSNTAAQIQPVETMIVAADPPAWWTDTAHTAPMGIGINISEPLPAHDYYPEPTQDNPGSGIKDAYGSIPSGPFPDHPEDSKSGRPLKDANLLATGTTEHCKTVFLQRLANPEVAYDPVKNPYRTVDWAPIDLTVFTGEDRKPADPNYPDDWDPDDPRSESQKKVYLATCQRNGSNQNLWEQSWTSVPATSSSLWKVAYAGTGDDVFTPNFTFDPGNAADRYHTLGFLNKDFGDPWKFGDLPAATGPDPDAYRKLYTGDPQSPFPWLAWNNRPFANSAELLFVPSSSSARLAHEFSLAKSENPYDATNAAGFGWPFGHLPNFFQASNTAGESPHLYRLLEYLRVPSPFVGLETVLNPSTTYFGDATNSDTILFRPPFNFLSHYREPGRLNINTIFQRNVWNAVMNGYPEPTAGPIPDYNDLIQSRQGHAASVAYPTWFANPFRSAGSSQFVPPLLPTGSASLVKRGVNVTQLRARSVDPDDTSAGHGDQPLFFAADTINEYRRTDRNASFAYQGLQRLSNVLTNRSNVYAVWITVGFFEVERVGTSSVHPDGYALGQELGSDTGEIKRHRAFYIIDRSIPVGFRRGEDLNSGNCVLLKRFIE